MASRAFESWLRELPAKTQAVIVLLYKYDLSIDEVAQRLGVSPGEVRRHLFRAVLVLRDFRPRGGRPPTHLGPAMISAKKSPEPLWPDVAHQFLRDIRTSRRSGARGVVAGRIGMDGDSTLLRRWWARVAVVPRIGMNWDRILLDIVLVVGGLLLFMSWIGK